MSEERDRARKIALRTHSSKKKPITYDVPDENNGTVDKLEVEWREPSQKLYRKILAEAGQMLGDAKIDPFLKAKLVAVQHLAYVPGTDELMFEKGDLESLDDSPIGCVIGEMAADAQLLMKVPTREEVRKNSTPTETSSKPS